jgi:hypothetical protein
MLHENIEHRTPVFTGIYSGIGEPAATVKIDDASYPGHLSHQDEVADLARYELLKSRLLDELERGEFTLRRLSNEIKSPGGRPGGISKERTEAQIRAWSENPAWGRRESRFSDSKCQAAQLEDALEARFKEIDQARESVNKFTPPRVLTSVSHAVFEGIVKARTLVKPVIISSPSGSGKTSGMVEYINRTRRAEGLDCPVWSFTLTSGILNPRAFLVSMLHAISGEWWADAREYALEREIRERTEGRGGVVIVDEGQQLGDASNGMTVINEARSFVDSEHFGLAFMDSGEIYRKMSGGNLAQLWNRFKTGRIDINGNTDEDVDLIMDAWRVSGVKEREYSVSIGTGSGQLRELCDVYAETLRSFGSIDYELMLKVRKSSSTGRKPR